MSESIVHASPDRVSGQASETQSPSSASAPVPLTLDSDDAPMHRGGTLTKPLHQLKGGVNLITSKRTFHHDGNGPASTTYRYQKKKTSIRRSDISSQISCFKRHILQTMCGPALSISFERPSFAE